MDQRNLKEELLELFHRSIHLLHRSGPHLRRQGRRPPMPPAQGRLMRLLAATGPVTQRELSERLDIRSASLSELLGKLEKPGWVRRRPNETDRRTIDIELTEEGDNMLQNIGNERAEMAGEIFGSLTEEELRQLHSLLGKLIGDWETRFEDEEPRFHGGRCADDEGRPARGFGRLRRGHGGLHHHHGHHDPHGSHDHHDHHGSHGHHDRHVPHDHHCHHGLYDHHAHHDPHGHHGPHDHHDHHDGDGLSEDHRGRRPRGCRRHPDDRRPGDQAHHRSSAADGGRTGDQAEGLRSSNGADNASHPDPERPGNTD